MAPYKEEFPIGRLVRVVPRERLEDFKRTWRFHHPLAPDQLSFGGRDAKVREVTYYDGGDALYVLEGLPGIWHEQCLAAAAKPV